MKSALLDRAEKAIMDVLRDVRPELVAAYGNVEFELKADKTSVTYLDHMVEDRLRAVLKPLDPGIGIQGEEHGAEGNTETYWLVDPIDGTEHFIRGIPGSKNLLCLIEKGEPVWALMYMFATDELWIARKGEGLRCNGKLTEMRYPDNLKRLVNVRKHIAGFCIIRDYSYVLSGKVDGWVGLGVGGSAWDYAPRGLLIQEAGGRAGSLGDDHFDFTKKNFVMTHRRNFDELMRLFVEAV